MRVRLAPASLTYGMRLTVSDEVAELVVDGVIDDEAEDVLKGYLARMVAETQHGVVASRQQVGCWAVA